MVFHSTVLFVANINHSKDFYTRILNFSVEFDFGKNIVFNNGLSLWEMQPEHIINRKSATENRTNRFELYFETENIDLVFETLNSAGVEFLHNQHEESWGQRTIRLFDPDNHLIEIGESMQVFVNNMFDKGLTTDQIAEKSGIPPVTVLDIIRKR
jgi:catechol 2,3-dioxygenase-like lactoylglutathione lyase family enzyme